MCLLAIERSGAQLKEMEAAGIAWVAWICKVPFFAIKSVTNLIDDNPDSANEFEKNFALAVANLTKTVLEVIDALAEEAGATGL
jgi:5'-methylthioadenosine nucleosidase